MDYFVDTVFNYPTLAECYKAAAFNGLNKLSRYSASPQRAGRGPQFPRATAWLKVATQAPFCGLLLRSGAAVTLPSGVR